MQEDMLILEQYERYGSRWSFIAKSLPGRTDNAIKNSWNCSICKRIQNLNTGERTLTPETPRKNISKRQRPMPRQTAESETLTNSKIVPIDLSTLDQRQVKMLQDMNILPEQGQHGEIAEVEEVWQLFQFEDRWDTPFSPGQTPPYY
jgi:hypothetical protein